MVRKAGARLREKKTRDLDEEVKDCAMCKSQWKDELSSEDSDDESIKPEDSTLAQQGTIPESGPKRLAIFDNTAGRLSAMKRIMSCQPLLVPSYCTNILRCAYCDEEFRGKWATLDHQITIHPELLQDGMNATFVCHGVSKDHAYCGKVFLRLLDVVDHEVAEHIHGGLDLQCPECKFHDTWPSTRD